MVHIVSSFCCWRWLFSCVCVCVVVCINIGTLLVVTVARLLFLYIRAPVELRHRKSSVLVWFFFWLFSYISFLSFRLCVVNSARLAYALIHRGSCHVCLWISQIHVFLPLLPYSVSESDRNDYKRRDDHDREELNISDKHSDKHEKRWRSFHISFRLFLFSFVILRVEIKNNTTTHWIFYVPPASFIFYFFFCFVCLLLLTWNSPPTPVSLAVFY
jgi:hypothetical protein